jgi:hypothetical protein
VTVEEARQS